MDEIRNMVSIMQSAEQNVLASRTDSMNKFAAYTPILMIFSAILAITITLVFFRRVNQDFREKTNLTSKLEEKNLETENRLKAIEKVTGQISNGDYDILSHENAQQNLGNVGKPLNRMAASLKDSFNTLETKECLSSSVATLNDRMMGDKTIENLASAVLETITEITGSSVAALYLQQDNFLHLSGSFAMSRENGPTSLNIGEGITGESFRTGKMQLVDDISESNITINYAAGGTKPTNIVALPITGATVSACVLVNAPAVGVVVDTFTLIVSAYKGSLLLAQKVRKSLKPAVTVTGGVTK